jgi:hypothetical protein
MVVAMYKSYSSKDAFWDDFSQPAVEGGDLRGPRFVWADIVPKARDLQFAADSLEVEAAKLEYGDAFTKMFSYKSAGQQREYSTPAKVAKRYRAMKGRPALWD